MTIKVEAANQRPHLPPKPTHLPRLAILHVLAMQTPKPTINSDHHRPFYHHSSNSNLHIKESQWPSSHS